MVMMSRVLLRVGGGGAGCGTTNICTKRGGGIKEGNRGWIALFHLTLSREREREGKHQYSKRGIHRKGCAPLCRHIFNLGHIVDLCNTYKRLLGEEEEVRIGSK